MYMCSLFPMAFFIGWIWLYCSRCRMPYGFPYFVIVQLLCLLSLGSLCVFWYLGWWWSWWFTSLSTSFKSYRDNGRLIMKHSVQGTIVQSSYISPLAGFETGSSWSEVGSAKHSGTRMFFCFFYLGNSSSAQTGRRRVQPCTRLLPVWAELFLHILNSLNETETPDFFLNAFFVPVKTLMYFKEQLVE